MTAELVYDSDNPCPHEHQGSDGCCDEHGGRIEVCLDCGMEL